MTTRASASDITVTPDTDPRFGRIWRLRAVQKLDHPIDAVFPFFADAHNLERLTPDFLRFEVLTPKPIEMRSGLILNYKLKVRGLPIRWTTEILDWDPPRQFVDNQAKGPYALWHHTHSFEPTEDGGTLCRDVVRYRPAGWFLAPLVNRLVVQRDVTSIIRYRFAQLGSIFPPRPASDQPEPAAPESMAPSVG